MEKISRAEYIVVGSKPNCVQCRATKRQIGKLGIANFLEIDLNENEELLNEAKENGVQSAPYVKVMETNEDGEMPAVGEAREFWSGYRPDRLIAVANRIGAVATELAATH